MSIEAIAWASRLALPPRDKFVLVALCDHYNRDEHAAWMRQSTLAEWTGYTRATVNAALEALEHEHKVITSETRRYPDGRNASKVYRLNISVKEIDSALARVNAVDPDSVNEIDPDSVNGFDNKNRQHRTVNTQPSSPLPPKPQDPTESRTEEAPGWTGTDRTQTPTDPTSHLVTYHQRAHRALVDFRRMHDKPVKDAQFKAWAGTVLEDVRAHGEPPVVDALSVTIENFPSLGFPFAFYRKALERATAAPTASDAIPTPLPDAITDLIEQAKAGTL